MREALFNKRSKLVKKQNVRIVICVQLKYLTQMQLGQHLILLLAGHQKLREHMVDHFEQIFKYIRNPRDSAAWGHLVTTGTMKCPNTLGGRWRTAGRLQGQAALVTE